MENIIVARVLRDKPVEVTPSSIVKNKAVKLKTTNHRVYGFKTKEVYDALIASGIANLQSVKISYNWKEMPSDMMFYFVIDKRTSAVKAQVCIGGKDSRKAYTPMEMVVFSGRMKACNLSEAIAKILEAEYRPELGRLLISTKQLNDRDVTALKSAGFVEYSENIQCMMYSNS